MKVCICRVTRLDTVSHNLLIRKHSIMWVRMVVLATRAHLLEDRLHLIYFLLCVPPLMFRQIAITAPMTCHFLMTYANVFYPVSPLNRTQSRILFQRLPQDGSHLSQLSLKFLIFLNQFGRLVLPAVHHSTRFISKAPLVEKVG